MNRCRAIDRTGMAAARMNGAAAWIDGAAARRNEARPCGRASNIDYLKI